MKRRNEYLIILILYSIFIFALSATPGKDIPSDVTSCSYPRLNFLCKEKIIK